MLERAKGCLEHNGRRLLRLQSDLGRAQHARNTFWSHGAGDIEIPAWWTDVLSKSTSQEKEKDTACLDITQHQLLAGVQGGCHLDFLYPPKTQTFLSKLATRGRARRPASCKKAPAVLLSQHADYKTSARNLDITADTAAQTPVEGGLVPGDLTEEAFGPSLEEHSLALESRFQDFEQSCRSYKLLVNHERDDFMDSGEILEAAEQILHHGHEAISSLRILLSEITDVRNPTGPSTLPHVHETGVHTHLTWEHCTVKPQLQELRDSLAKYSASSRIYSRTKRAADIVDPELSSDAVRRELLRSAELSLADGESALIIARGLGLQYCHERKSVKNNQSMDKGHANKSRLQELRDAFAKYHASSRIYDRTQRTAELVDPKLRSAPVRRELLQIAEQTLADADTASAVAGELVREYLRDRKSSESTQLLGENNAARPHLQELRDSLTKYDASSHVYDRLQRTAEFVDPELSSGSTRRELLQIAEKTLADADSVLVIAHELVLEYLHERKGIENWSARDWKVALEVHFRQRSTGSPRFIQTLENMFESGLADVGIPVIINMLVADESATSSGVARLYLCHQLFTGYTAWRETLPDDEQQTKKHFWDYAKDRDQGPPLSGLGLLYKRLKNRWEAERHSPPKTSTDGSPQTTGTLISPGQGPNATAKGQKRPVREYLNKLAVRVSQAENIIALAETIISHQHFQEIDSHTVLDIFNWLIDVVREAPASYETMAKLLRVILFTPLGGQKRIHADLNAFKLFEAMEIHGGYSGETTPGAPDLARKLYHNLRKSKLQAQMVRIMTHLQSRFVDRLEDYYSLRMYLASIRDLEGLAAQDAAYARAVERKRKLHGDRTDLIEIFGAPPLDIYKNRLELYRRRREPHKMLEVMEEIKADPDCDADQQCYNKVISGHARSNDLDGADLAFQSLVDAGFKPDVYAYIPIMETLAREGNISAVRDLTKQIDLHGIPINDWIINAHVTALLQRGRLTSAEALVRKALMFNLVDRTTMWNQVILHWALRGHRTKVNQLMDIMRKANVPYDAYTYAARMTLWIKRGSPRRAWSILHTTLPRLGLRPLPLHYALMVRAYTNGMGLRQEKIPAVYRHMIRFGVQPNRTVVNAFSAAYLRARMSKLPRSIVNGLEELASEVNVAGEVTHGTALPTGGYQPQEEAFQTGLFTLIYGLSGPDAHGAFDRVWESYVGLGRPGVQLKPIPGSASPPMQVLYRMMSTFSSKRAWADVERCWKSVVRKVESVAKMKDGEVFPLHRFMLAGPLKQYLNCLYEEGASIKRVKNAVYDVLQRGFALDNRCWNLYVRLLCVSGPENHLLALQTAEEQLVFGRLSYPPVLGKVTIPESRANIIRSKFEKRLTRSSQVFRDKARPHCPFRMESSIGQGLVMARSKSVDNLRRPFRIQDATSWSEIGDAAQKPALDFKALGKNKAQSAVDQQTLAGMLSDDNAELTRAMMGRLDKGEALAKTGLVGVRAFLDEGSLLRRPEYDTLVYLAGIYLQLRRRLTFESKGTELLREIHQTVPRLMRMIMRLPRVDDKLQKAFLRDR